MASPASASSDPYQVLGVSRQCSREDVTRAFRRLAKLHHPDKGGTKESFQAIQAAYEQLSSLNNVCTNFEDASSARDESTQQEKARSSEDSRKAAQAAWEERCRQHAQAKAARDREAAERRQAKQSRMPRRLSRREQQIWEEQQDPEAWARMRAEQEQEKAREQTQRMNLKRTWSAEHRARTAGASRTDRCRLLQQADADEAARAAARHCRSKRRQISSIAAMRAFETRTSIFQAQGSSF
eukprot:TRINITY_DN72848_c0_g1_i1.p1 TRINITY_DN72848_c0_g1~~TRINITY_DN72848_c0_g1_i1.p1  ORF type:complete len:240 (-),score=35.03 TRINITY_DN72848_c0_g1_i1:237-956(-)